MVEEDCAGIATWKGLGLLDLRQNEGTQGKTQVLLSLLVRILLCFEGWWR
jgi:hypothetical protein